MIGDRNIRSSRQAFADEQLLLDDLPMGTLVVAEAILQRMLPISHRSDSVSNGVSQYEYLDGFGGSRFHRPSRSRGSATERSGNSLGRRSSRNGR
ncbi:hypothetical protein THIOKS12770002 [Thiocapsa sp. KS1]|nr:hypothetical protein THIOKS12770002 [Thiocapsa sp. KS1]